ncbi:bis(5'-nucleosyl)-tetraphosphatase (symmetrical) YqeK [bacterium]|nr:bis(5'-nucleosyl)-tetraphosphatase (symmetrical) YqeK [bacterium]
MLSSETKNILIYSGAFNPPHVGHLKIVLNTINALHFDGEIIINIDKHSPWKKDGDLVPYSYRKNMLINLFGKTFNYSIYENKKNLVYARDIIEDIKNKYPIANLYYLVGEDQYKLIEKWEDYLTFNNFVIIVCHCRSNHKKIKQIDPKHEIVYDQYIPCDSATIKKTLAVKYLGNKNLDYIKKNHLYLQYKIADMLTEHRYQHTLRVLDTITTIAYANLFSEQDILRAQIAAILHDIAKSWEHEQYLKLFSPSFLKIFPSFHCAHGHAAAEIAKTKFKITDNIILDALRNHVIYKDNSNNKIAKALYCADKLEPARLPTDITNREELLEECCKNLNKGFASVLRANTEKYK